jgi:tetratricopeptide (TPR) repeat protein
MKMLAKRFWIVVLAALCIRGTSYAGEILYREALTRYNQAVKAQQSGDMDKAKAEYQKALALAEGSRKDITKAIYNNFGVIYMNKGDWEMAARSFNEALLLDPGYKAANFNIGILYAKTGNAKKALEYWGRALDKTDSYILEGEIPE